MKRKTILYILLTVMIIGSLTGCKEKEGPTQQVSEQTEIETDTELYGLEPVTEQIENEPTHEGQSLSYLSGEWIDSELAKKRPIALMVENTKMALPQYGLGQADIIYECPVEGGISRLMALYQDYSGMDKVGNVRSCRHYYAYFAKEFDAIYFHAGASSIAYKGVLSGSYIEDVDGITGAGGQYFFRDNSEKVAPHNLYTSSELMKKAIEHFNFEPDHSAEYAGHYQFSDDTQPNLLENGQKADKISLYYQNAKPWFEYNKEDGFYYRFEFGAPQKDGLTGNQLAVKNIILQNCNVKVVDDVGRLDIDFLSGGKGLYLTNGKCINITWTRDSEYDITHYYDENGQELILNPGKTWVEIVQDNYADQNIVSE